MLPVLIALAIAGALIFRPEVSAPAGGPAMPPGLTARQQLFVRAISVQFKATEALVKRYATRPAPDPQIMATWAALKDEANYIEDGMQFKVPDARLEDFLGRITSLADRVAKALA